MHILYLFHVMYATMLNTAFKVSIFLENSEFMSHEF